jgi:L-lactate dehydrogenase
MFAGGAGKRNMELQDQKETYGATSETGIGGRKVVVVGAGEVGSDFAYALMISGLATSIGLIDLAPHRAEGHVMDLNHGLPFVQPVRIYRGDYADCEDADVVVVTAGAAQKPGETRMDLARKNTEIFKEIIPEISRYTPRIILIVSNPVDVLTHVALKLSKYPASRVIGSGTVLDSARFRYLISRCCGVDPRNVHAYVMGEHGDSETAVWSQTNIAGIPLNEYCPSCDHFRTEEQRESFFNEVRNAAYEIINRKGATSFAIGLALVRIVGSILRDESSVLTVSTLLKDSYGLKDVCLSVPVVLNRNGVSRVLGIPLNESELNRLHASAHAVKGAMEGLGLP